MLINLILYKKKEKRNYFLAVGASWPHKNIHSFIKNKKVWSDSYNLIIVCGRTDYAMSLQQMVVDLELKDKVTFLHEVSFNELKILYSKAYALVYPSIDEVLVYLLLKRWHQILQL